MGILELIFGFIVFLLVLQLVFAFVPIPRGIIGTIVAIILIILVWRLVF